MAALLATEPRKVVVRTEISTAPASAVPMEAPEVRHRVLDPAHLAALLVGHRRHRDGTELRRQAPDAEPGQQQRPGDHLGTRTLVESDEQHDDAEKEQAEPDAHDAPGRRVREEPGHTDRGSQEGDRQGEEADAGRHGREPERHREEQRQDEEQAGLEQELEEEGREAGPELQHAQHPGVDQDGTVASATACSPTARTAPGRPRPRA